MQIEKHIIGPVEMQEYLFASGVAEKYGAKFNMASTTEKELTTEIREILRLHRFAVFNWLLMAGVPLDVQLLADATHPKVGFQLPDQPVQNAAK